MIDTAFGALTSREAPPIPRPRPQTDRSQTQNLDEIDESGWTAVRTASTDDDEWQQHRAVRDFDRAVVALGVAFHDDFGADLDSASRDGLRRFIKQTRLVSRPSIGAQSNGRIVATWTQGGRALSVEFTERLRFNFALTVEVDGVPRRYWGAANTLTFFDEQPQAKAFLIV